MGWIGDSTSLIVVVGSVLDPCWMFWMQKLPCPGPSRRPPPLIGAHLILILLVTCTCLIIEDRSVQNRHSSEAFEDD